MCFVLLLVVGPVVSQNHPAVSSLNTTLYAGRWYQVYGSHCLPIVHRCLELGGQCVTADYGRLTRADVLTVQNAVMIPDAGVIKVNGYAIVNPRHAGELSVHLGPPSHSPDPAKPREFRSSNYAVIGLGPVVADAYDYALIADGSLGWYVLARNTSRFEARYEAAVLQQLEELNFTRFFMRPSKTNQTNCEYAPPPTTLVLPP